MAVGKGRRKRPSEKAVGKGRLTMTADCNLLGIRAGSEQLFHRLPSKGLCELSPIACAREKRGRGTRTVSAGENKGRVQLGICPRSASPFLVRKKSVWRGCP